MALRSTMLWLRRLPFSREGLFWVLIAVAMLVTGLFKGINLITLLASWILVLAALNWWLARRQLFYLDAERTAPELIFARTPFRWRVKVSNRGLRPAHSLTVHDDAALAGFFVGQLLPQAGVAFESEITLPHRGAVACAPLRLTCGYPVGLARVTRTLPAGDEVIVAPRLGRLQRGVFRRWLSQHCRGLGPVRAAPHRHPAAHTEFHGLRPFRAGDSPRHIHWRTTARRGDLMIREFEDWPNDNLILLVDPWLATAAAPGDHSGLEYLLSLAATIVWEWCRQKGDDLVLGVAGAEPQIVQGPTGMTLAVEALRSLGRAEGTPHNGAARLLDALEEILLPAAPIVILTLRGEELADAIHDRWHRATATISFAASNEVDFFELEYSKVSL